MHKLIENPQFWTWVRCTTLTIIIVGYVHFGYKNPPTTVDFAFWINVIAGVWGIDATKKKVVSAMNKEKAEEKAQTIAEECPNESNS